MNLAHIGHTDVEWTLCGKVMTYKVERDFRNEFEGYFYSMTELRGGELI